MAMILPLPFVFECLRGRALFVGGAANPSVRLFLASIAGIGVTVPLVIIGARAAPSGATAHSRLHRRRTAFPPA